MLSTRGSRPYSVLITDDDRDFRETLRACVEPVGLRALEAESGEEAIHILQRTEVHLALLDMHMPSLSGLETLRIVKQFREALPCILVTADATRQLMEAALSAQAFTVLRKPVSRPLVLSTIRRALLRTYDGVDLPPLD